MIPPLRTVAVRLAMLWTRVPEGRRRALRPLVHRAPGFQRLRELELQARSDGARSPGSRSSARWVGSEDPVLLIAGHSHRYAFADYFNRFGHTAIALLETESRIDSAAHRYWAMALATAREKQLPLAIIWAGNQHNSHFLLESDARFSVYPATGPWEDGCPRPLVPRSLIREFLAPSLDPLRAILKKSAGVKVMVLGTPPPKSDDQIRESIDNETWLAEWAASLGMTVSALRITPLPVRVELWKIMQDLLREVSDECGVTFIEVPERARVSGALTAEASAPDSTHANGVWAEIMIEEAAVALAVR